MLKLTLNTLLLLLTLTSFSQNAKSDDLVSQEKALEEATSDTAKIRILCDLSRLTRVKDIKQSQAYLAEAHDLAVKAGDRISMTRVVISSAAMASARAEYDKAILKAEKALNILNADTSDIKNNSNTEIKLLGMIYQAMGTAYDWKSNYTESVKYFLKSLKAYEYINHPIGIGVNYNNLGISHLYMREFEKAEDYFQKAFDIYVSVGDTNTAYAAKMNLAIIDHYEGDHEGALAIFKECVEYHRSVGNTRSEGNALNNVGNAFAMIEEYDSAMYYFQMGLAIDIELDDKQGTGQSLQNIGEIYALQGNYSEARKHLEKSLEMALETKRNIDISARYKFMAELEEEAKNPSKALEYYRQYIIYHDSVVSTMQSTEIGKMEAQYTFDKEMELTEAENQKRLQLAKEREEKQAVITYFSIGIGCVILILGLIVLRSLVETRKQKRFVDEAKAEIEQKNEELLDSIKYAQRIQNALLQNTEIYQDIPSHFTLFKPKDIVSGDFHWSYHTEKYWYAAAVDCTGHGVPGALLTMLGTAYLNEICSADPEIEPAKLLDQLKAKITKELDQRGQKDDTKDGMDISLIRYSLSDKKVDWAGANNSLYFVQNEELKEIKPDKQPIGYSDDVKPFTNHSVPINTGDSLYLFTDGYADQFGGEKGKKFKYSNFKRLLFETDKEAAETQKEILEQRFNDWKGELEQLDDVCIIGIRI